MLSIQEGDEPLRFACNNINGVHIKITKKHLCISNILKMVITKYSKRII